jgi:hypothetical protein
MPTVFRNRFTARYRWVIGLCGAIATVAVLVLIYRLTAPRTTQTTTASGQQIPESEILKVGALPVT